VRQCSSIEHHTCIKERATPYRWILPQVQIKPQGLPAYVDSFLNRQTPVIGQQDGQRKSPTGKQLDWGQACSTELGVRHNGHVMSGEADQRSGLIDHVTGLAQRVAVKQAGLSCDRAVI